MARVCLAAVVSGEVYERYAEDLFLSAHEYFETPLKTVMLEGRPGWPDATLYRYHVLLEHTALFKDSDYVFLSDADMRFEGPVGDEILGELVATQHPGYVGQPRTRLPYESRSKSAACTPWGTTYYAGGFVGGERARFLGLAWRIATQIDHDDHRGITARWHDESHLNKILASDPPTLTLSPAYCHPDDDTAYVLVWPQQYDRKLVALDKTPAERSAR